MSQSNFFVTGGALLASASSYVARAADRDLLAALKRNEFCYGLTTRQMGKTSLMVRTAAQLREDGWAVVVLDLTAYGQNLDVEQWYFSMLSDVGAKLKLEDEMEDYWEQNAQRAPLHRFMGAIRELYLEKKRKPLAIFVDEIDVVRSLHQFKADEFFAGIRECFHRRNEDARFERLTFCLLGVATPSDLIADPQMTPFNIGRAIELTDFTPDEASVLAAGLSPYRETALRLLERVLWWTGGHPYLTQRLCAEVSTLEIQTPGQVDVVCDNVFLSAEARGRDENLQFVRDRLLRSDPDPAALLDSYARVCRQKGLAYDDQSPVHNELRLAGIVRVANGTLQPRNRIYSHVFDLKWVRENLPDAEFRRQRAAYWRGVRLVAGAALLVLAVMGYLVDQLRRTTHDERQALEREKNALQQAEIERQHRLEEQEKQAKVAQAQAEEGRRNAERQQALATAAKRAAEDAQRATEREAEANKQRLAEAERTKAVLKQVVETQTQVASLLEAMTPYIGPKSGKEILDRAEALVASLSIEASEDPRVQLGLVGLHRVCGRLYLRLGNEAKALAQAEAARNLVTAELSLPAKANGESWLPERDALNKLLFECEMLIGDSMLAGRGPEVHRTKKESDYQRAMEVYGHAAKLARDGMADHPDDAKWRELYYGALLTAAQTATQFKQEADAEKRLNQAITEVTAAQTKLTNAPDLARFEAEFRDQLGTLHLGRGQLAEARSEFDRALKLREERITDASKEDHETLSALAQSYNKLGRLSFDAGRYEEAAGYHERALSIRRGLREQNPRIDWGRNLGFSLYNYSQTLWRLKRNQEALRIAEERVTLAEEMFNQDRTDANLKFDYANALFAYADILLNVADPALQDRTKSLEITKDAVQKTERRDPRLLSLLSQALRLNNRVAEAYAVAEEASQLLPPPEKRNEVDKDVAREIDFELKKSRAGVARSATVTSGRKKPRR